MTPLSADKPCVLIPSYCAANSIADVVRSVRQMGYEVLVVDDGSTDETLEMAKRAGAETISYQPNRGKGAALRAGFEHYLKHCAQFGVILMDSDGQHDPSDLDGFTEALIEGRGQLIVGNRMGRPTGMPWIRRQTNRFMSWFLSRMIRQSVPDTQCGYRALTREAIERMALKADRFEIESEMLLEASRARLKIASIPIRSVYADERSHIRPLRDTKRFIQFIRAYRRRKSR